MALQIIARGKLVGGGFLGEDPTLWLASGKGQGTVLIDILERLKPYIGQTITISYEEPSKEPESASKK